MRLNLRNRKQQDHREIIKPKVDSLKRPIKL